MLYSRCWEKIAPDLESAHETICQPRSLVAAAAAFITESTSSHTAEYIYERERETNSAGEERDIMYKKGKNALSAALFLINPARHNNSEHYYIIKFISHASCSLSLSLALSIVFYISYVFF